MDDHISEPNTSHLGNGFHPTVESHHPATLSQSQNSMDLGSAPQWIFSDEERRKSNGLASTASPFLAEKVYFMYVCKCFMTFSGIAKSGRKAHEAFYTAFELQFYI